MDADGTPLAVLFAQISGSAALYELLGNSQAADAVNGALAVLKAAVEKHRGTAVKTVGEKLIAHFDSADLALRAASAMQAAMGGLPEGLAVQVGFTWGPVIEHDQDIFGGTVNLAARMVAMANPRQILTTRQAVETMTPIPRSICRNLYTTTVRGKTEGISVYEAIWNLDQGSTVIASSGVQEPPRPATLKLASRGRTWDMNESRDELAAGRDPAGDIVVSGDKVSRYHARIFLRHGKFVIADQSANGTYVRTRDREEILLHREEFVLLGRGSIGLGQRVVKAGEDAISYELG